MNRIQAFTKLLVTPLWLILLALLSCSPSPVGSMDVQVNLTTDQLRYGIGEPIVVTIDNQLSESIFGFTGWTYCTLLIAQQRTGEDWQFSPGECPLEMRQVPVEIPAHSQHVVELIPGEGDPPLAPAEYRIRFTYRVGTETAPDTTVYSLPFVVETPTEPPEPSATAPVVPEPGMITSTTPVTPIHVGTPAQSVTATLPLSPTAPLTTPVALVGSTAATVTLTPDRLAYALEDPLFVTIANGYDQPVVGLTGQTYCTILILEQQIDNAWQRTSGECQSEARPLPVEIAAGDLLVVELARLPTDPPLETGDYRVRFTFQLSSATGPQLTVYSPPFSIGTQAAGSLRLQRFPSLLASGGS